MLAPRLTWQEEEEEQAGTMRAATDNFRAGRLQSFPAKLSLLLGQFSGIQVTVTARMSAQRVAQNSLITNIDGPNLLAALNKLIN